MRTFLKAGRGKIALKGRILCVPEIPAQMIGELLSRTTSAAPGRISCNRPSSLSWPSGNMTTACSCSSSSAAFRSAWRSGFPLLTGNARYSLMIHLINGISKSSDFAINHTGRGVANPIAAGSKSLT